MNNIQNKLNSKKKKPNISLSQMQSLYAENKYFAFFSMNNQIYILNTKQLKRD